MPQPHECSTPVASPSQPFFVGRVLLGPEAQERDPIPPIEDGAPRARQPARARSPTRVRHAVRPAFRNFTASRRPYRQREL